MKKWLAIGLTLCVMRVCSAQTLNQCEGPYVEYRKNDIIIRAMDADGKVSNDSFPVAEKDKHPIEVHFSNHSGWDFSVPLQKKLKDEPYNWGKVDRIIAFSDIEGEFYEFRAQLIANQVIDEKNKLIF
jgi:hypothetical protein